MRGLTSYQRGIPISLRPPLTLSLFLAFHPSTCRGEEILACFIKELHKRPQSQSGYQRSQADNSSCREAYNRTEHVAGHTAPEVGDLFLLFAHDQRKAVIRRHAYIGGLV